MIDVNRVIRAIPLVTLITVTVTNQHPNAKAQSTRSQMCSYTDGKWIKTRNTDMGSSFMIKWSDGPRMTYKWVGSNADLHNLSDSIGGTWNYSDHRNGSGFTLVNLKNRNKVRCK